MAASRGLSERSRQLVAQVVDHVKAQGIFDQFRRDCMEELERKESYRQLKQRVESHVATFLSKQEWTDSLPKNQVRDSLRRNFQQSEVLQKGVERLVSQALNEKAGSFRDRIGDVVQTIMFTEQHHETTNRLKQEEGKEELKGAKSHVKSSDISQLIPCSSPQVHSNAHVGKAEQKPKLRTTSENTRAVTARKTEKPAISKTVSSADVAIKAPEVDLVTAKSVVLGPAVSEGTGATDAGSAVQERETSEVDPQTLPSGNVSGKAEAKEGNSEEKQIPVSLHIEQKEVSCLGTRPYEDPVNSLHEEKKWIEERETRDEGQTHSLTKPRYLSDKVADTSVICSNKPAFVNDVQSSDWSPDVSTEHAAGHMRQGSQGSAHETQQDEDKETSGELSDAHSDISEVSSVHTSDLSSFDDQISSVTDDEEEQSPRIHDTDEAAVDQQERPRRSTRISSRRSTREDEEEQNEPKSDQAKRTSDGTEAKRKPREHGQTVVEVVKRKRGRPRKTDRPSSHVGRRKSHQARKRKSGRKNKTLQESDGESSDLGRKRSQRRIKRTRCYSPSSEGTREVHLPYKRSRVSSKD